MTMDQTEKALLSHAGMGRTEGFVETLDMVRNLSRRPEERRDHPNIKDHLSTIEMLAHGNVLELGSWEGASTGALLAGVEKRGGKVWSVDSDPKYADAWRGHPLWNFITADSCDVESISSDGLPESIDVLLIDTEHTYAQLKKELAIWHPRMSPDGIIIVHDVESFPEVFSALKDFMKEVGRSNLTIHKGCCGLAVWRMKEEDRNQQKPPARKPVRPTAELDATISSVVGGKDVSFVILDATGSPRAIRCIESIRKHVPGAEIVLVANGVPIQPSLIGLANFLIPIEGNIGFAAGCNRGASSATRELICFLNDDACFSDDETPRLLIQKAREGKIAGPFSNYAKPPQGNCSRERTPPINIPVDMVVGMCMMMPRTVFLDLGGFDARFLNWEDDDLCKRAKKKGIDSVIVGKSWVEHEGHASFKELKIDVDDAIRRNRLTFNRKHPKVTVLAIGKNEENSLLGYYGQYREIADSFKLLDTGSTDRTVEVARSNGIVVKSAGFQDFASNRNLAIDLLGEDAGWIIMHDPDERLDPDTIRSIPELIFNAQHDIYLSPLRAVYPDGSKRTFVSKPFLFRNRPELRWVFKVHEKLIGSHKQALVTNAMIEHILILHEDGRRKSAGSMYDDLAAREPYFTDAAYKQRMRQEWPILDYDRTDDPRIDKIQSGPLVSVVIPTFDRPVFLERAIGSAQKQTWQNIEIIVVGDGCPRMSMVKARDSIHNDPRVRFLNLKENHGSGGAVPRNVAIQMAQGEYIAYLDDDNEWLPDHISSIIEEIRNKGAKWGFSSMSVKGKDLRFDRPEFQAIDTSCVIHPKEFFGRFGPWKNRIEGGYAHDWEFISRFKDEPWACSRKPTLIYNADTSGQADFLQHLAEKRSRPDEIAANFNRILADADPVSAMESLKKPISPVLEQDVPKLSILIAALDSRVEVRKKLIDFLQTQCERLPRRNESEVKPVEVVILSDPGKMTLGTKRNDLISMAKGRYVAFIDDDDTVSDTYIEDIIAAIDSKKPDCVTFDGIITTDGKEPTKFRFSLDYPQNAWGQDAEGTHMRSPSHLCAIRSDIARKVKFWEVDCGEDRIWAIELWPHLNSEVHIGKVLYLYRYDTQKTGTQTPERIARSQEILKKFRYTPAPSKKI